MKITISDNLYLRRFSSEQAVAFYESIHEYIDVEDDYRERLKNKHKKVQDTEAIILDAVDDKFLLDGTPDFFIYYNEKIVGVFEFAPLQEKVNFVEVGYWLYRKYRRKGILSSVFPYMIKYAQENFDRPRLIATTPRDNIASQKLLEKCSFTNTGRIQEFKKDSGIVEKDVEYELLLNMK